MESCEFVIINVMENQDFKKREHGILGGMSLISDQIRHLENEKDKCGIARFAEDSKERALDDRLSNARINLENLRESLDRLRLEQKSAINQSEGNMPTLNIDFNPEQWAKEHPGYTHKEKAAYLYAFSEAVRKAANKEQEKANKADSLDSNPLSPPRPDRRGVSVGERKVLGIVQFDKGKPPRTFVSLKNNHLPFASWLIHNGIQFAKNSWEKGCAGEKTKTKKDVLIRGVPIWSTRKNEASYLDRYQFCWPYPGKHRGIWFVKGIESEAFPRYVKRLAKYMGVKVELKLFSLKEAQKWQDRVDEIK